MITTSQVLYLVMQKAILMQYSNSEDQMKLVLVFGGIPEDLIFRLFFTTKKSLYLFQAFLFL